MDSANFNFDYLISFIRNEILGEGDEAIIVNRDTSLERDLGLSGIDAEKFILKFAQTFNVDIHDFNIDEYFEPEFEFKQKHRNNFTVSKLEESIRLGYLR
ncbi:DUF1493 family protein [Chitinophaga sp. YIM B06452]|uniref:DUF1493 family protein n=1 Tax=Chitinophaga sp. YIM B06452 TaxID=3082158 RepID=UPI0031FEE6F9